MEQINGCHEVEQGVGSEDTWKIFWDDGTVNIFIMVVVTLTHTHKTRQKNIKLSLGQNPENYTLKRLIFIAFKVYHNEK